ncbi:hypothetical protein OC195_17290 [Priestia flexa]|nr:hypothetical protein OC195_17290 [Priestia flexa]
MDFQQLIVAHLLAISMALVLDAIIGDPVNCTASCQVVWALDFFH